MNLTSRIGAISLVTTLMAGGAAAQQSTEIPGSRVVIDITDATGIYAELRNGFALSVSGILDLRTLDGQSGTITYPDGTTFETTDVDVFCGPDTTLVQFGAASGDITIGDLEVQFVLPRPCVISGPQRRAPQNQQDETVPATPRGFVLTPNDA